MGVRPGFQGVAEDVLAAGAESEAVEVGDVVGVGVGDEDEFEGEAVVFDEFDDGVGVGAGVEGGGAFGGGVPDDVSVDGHVAEQGVEAGEAGHFDGAREPGVLGEGDEGGAVEVEDGGEGEEGGGIGGAVFGGLEEGEGDAGGGGEVGV